MTAPVIAWCLTFLFLGSSGQNTLLRQERTFNSTDVGSNVTLPCFYDPKNAVMIYWFKQTVGQKLNMFSSHYRLENQGRFHNEFKDNPRFELEAGSGKNHLRISDLQPSDSATYFCVAIDSNKFEFGDGATVNVEGPGSNIHTLVHQPEGPVTLTCSVDTGSCDGENSFYWFKEAKESQAGIIYTPGGRNGGCSKTMTTATQSCDYVVPLMNLDVSNDGVASCAVASCGSLLFEDGENMESADELISPELVVHFLSGALTVTVILSAVMAFSIWRIKKTIRSHCAAKTDAEPAERHAADTEGNEDEESLQYSTLRQHRSNGSRRQRDDTRSQCVYASVKQAKSTLVAATPDNTLYNVC
ncbi:V-set and immunoglobulin domain-containing protein 1-like [Poecilia latipinna]|uniref:V-set and immunoglobulin domain-containing protein 1-like n=1 Tax=Poecilia mexicana TaxID=48701 RepID=UPI00072E8D48|nr:PREDICTED: V-set and immunoglobulin domain-containing protein 1-like [Poecilia mexicana]XP_014905939.1 PREDICTED: V-set and immunoglobulin domain-containing protein 1-like [Poecilia latipinna]